MIFTPASDRFLKDITQPLCFRRDEERQNFPEVAATILALPGVREVMLTSDNVTVNLDAGASWSLTSPEVCDVISSAVAAHPDGLSYWEDGAAGLNDGAHALDEWSLETEIADVIEQFVMPYVRSDGGDIRLTGFDEESGIVYVQLLGACSGCPSSSATLHDKVARTLKHFVPQVEGVQLSDDAPVEPAVEDHISIEEHMRRLASEGAATSIIWQPGAM